MEGLPIEDFFQGGLSKIGELLIITASLLSKPSVILLLPVFQQRNPVNTVTNGQKKIGRINGWPY